MAAGQGIEAVEVTIAEPVASAADILALDESEPLVHGQHGDDSASDVPMTTETDEEEDVDTSAPHPWAAQFEPAAVARNVAAPMEEDFTRKRKSPGDVSDSGNRHGAPDSVKKVKLAEVKEEHQGDDNPSSDRSKLPAEIWQYIFTFCSPRTLGALLLVNRLFNVYLNPSSRIQCEQPHPLSRTAVPMSKPNSIWQASRRRFWPSMASPLQGKTELYMWQLSCSFSCQHCGARTSQHQESTDPWQSGPGKDGIAIIWPFATRSCGLCLLSKSVKEIDILLSSSIPSTLTAALPFVFVTRELHAVSPATVERSQPPASGQLTKLYWSAHVEDLKQEFFSTKAMGTATVEEWLKGLDGRGTERRNDASRWEKWATINGGLRQMRTVLYPGYQPPAFVSRGGTAVSVEGIASRDGHNPGVSATNDSSPSACPSEASSQRNDSTPEPYRRSSSGTVSYLSGRHERTKEEVAELKAERKAEIERRAFALDPPLPANVLAHVPSFQAALQIITPMDDQGWELLKPRLLAQRADAEQREKESVARVKKELDERRSLNAITKEARDARVAEDWDWDEAQAPVRARIAGYADEIIRDGWENGEKIARDSCAKFAIEALTYIRKRFYAEVAKDAAAARAAGKQPTKDPPQGPFTQKLTLENMKWIFDVKVKPLTERYRKEIFLCNGCDVTVRSYGFEGVIQHYAAKHTTALSIGNVVVHWRAEWPEHPPFTSEPKSSKNMYHARSASGYNAQIPKPSPTYQPALGGPVPGYGPSSWGEPLPPGSNAPYPMAGGGFVPPQVYGTTPYPPTDSFNQFPPAQTQQPSYNGPAQPAPGGSYNYNYGAYQSNSQIAYQSTQPSPFSAQYSTQLEDLAHMARDLWNSTANMKDILSIVRVQVVVYHLAKRFHAKFHIPLPLSTFIDGLSNHKDMRPVRNVNGLVCRVCHQGIGGYVASEEERKSWSLPQLTAHFQNKHVEPFVQMGQYGQQPEWTVEMVLLPDPTAVTNLRAAISSDGHKYHLVNEAVPHLLEVPSVPQPATDGAPSWHDGNTHYQGYLAVPAENSAPYGAQIQLNSSIQDGATGQYTGALEAAAQYPQEAPSSYNHAEPLSMGTKAISPAGAQAPAEPVPAVHSEALSRSDDVGNKSSQGHRQRFKKYKKKGNKRDSVDEEARKRTEEEEKMAEEEAEREADVIRAMWAADRAVAATKSVAPEGQQAEKKGKTNKSVDLRPHSKPNTPKQSNRFQSRQPKNSPRRDEGASPTGAPNSHVDPLAPTQTDIAYRGHQLSNVAHVDGSRDEPPRQEWQRSPNPNDRYGPPPSGVGRRISRSPVHQDYGRQPPPAGQYRQRSPRRQPADEPVYQPRPSAPVDMIRYEDEHPRDEYSSRGYGAPAPAPELIEYEIIEYRNPDGTIYVEERPLRRIPNSEAERYYREAPPPVSVPYDRRDPLPPLPSSYRREQPPPPPPPPSGEQYHPPYERAYSRAAQAQPLPQAGAEVYDPRYAFDPHPRRNEPPPPSRPAPAYYEEEEYDPRYPNGPSSVSVVAPFRPNYR